MMARVVVVVVMIILVVVSILFAAYHGNTWYVVRRQLGCIHSRLFILPSSDSLFKYSQFEP